ncbi:MAG: Gfo/Idh/MocA family oxidoreductase [Gammaproteobacteria bacterium]|nr:Gfo/Idh/MocA family oxidoreductase [Gammaproteobacteria bacterium]
MTKNAVTNIAQIGVGYWGPNLLRNLVANARCKVRTVVDQAEDRRKYVEGLYPGVKVVADSADPLKDPTIEAVVIATPVATHFDLVVKALEAGKHVLVEKPMATTVAEVETIGELAKRKGLVAMVGHTFIYNAAVRYLKKLIDSGELGEVRYIYSQRLNLGRIRSDVDALWNLAPHDISILQYLLGDPDPVQCTRHGMAFIQPGVDDVVFLNIVYPNRIMANIHVSWLDPSKIRCMTVVGSKKMAVYDDVADHKIAIYDKGIDKVAVLGKDMDFDYTDFFKFQHRSGDVLFPKIDFKEPLGQEINHFLDCIQLGTECMTGSKHAAKVTAILAT